MTVGTDVAPQRAPGQREGFTTACFAPGDRVVGLRVHQINRRFAAACAAAGLEGRRTSHGGRVGLAAELAARGAPMRAIQLAGGWKSPSMVVRYAAAVTTRGGAVRRFLG